MLKRITLAILATVAGLTGAGFGYLYFRDPEIAPPAPVKVKITAQRIERGKHLFEHVADCDGCHSERDWTRFGGPVVTAGRGKGNIFPGSLGFPGTVVAPNITPDEETGIGAWTDGEKIRAIREGISRDGSALFPFMPYQRFRHMSDEDVYSIVAYLNTLRPVRSALSRTRLDFPVSMLIRSAPKPAGQVAVPDPGDKLQYGKYLVNLAGCITCHTPEQKGEMIAGREFAGGNVFRFPTATVVSSNISPDCETGIGRWTEQDFVEKVYQYRDYALNGSPEVGPEGFTIMPWLMFSHMSPDELGAIYTYLKTQKPIYNAVETHPAQ
ncbi:MAG: c-type cytochrome [Bryobacteraceae bacterium]